MPGSNIIYYFREESQIWCMDASFDADMSRTIFKVTVILTYDLVSRLIVSGLEHIFYAI